MPRRVSLATETVSEQEEKLKYAFASCSPPEAVAVFQDRLAFFRGRICIFRCVCELSIKSTRLTRRTTGLIGLTSLSEKNSLVVMCL